ncbi:MAG: lysylphosphatidylglycerol synthase transmembrane domain-containing protein [Myxococcales bacterium]
MKGLMGRVLLGVAAGVAIYVGVSIWANAREVGQALARFYWPAALAAAALAAGNYGLRWVRWEFYLRRLKIRISTADSVLVFLAGFALTVTPGKLGEAVKALLLRQSHGIPAARTAPIVIAERITDLIALLLLALVGVFTFELDRRFLAAGAAAVAITLLVIGSETLSERILGTLERVKRLARFVPKLREFHAATALLLRPVPLLITTLLSAGSWFLECLAFWLVVRGFPGAQLGVQAATFIYAAMTVAGALSFLPGGLGLTEAGMLALLTTFGSGIPRGTAAAATFVTRACTLWFAVAIGVAALMLYARRTGTKVPAVGALENGGTAEAAASPATPP